ncbi:transcriptional regulator, partial [Microbacterium paludicola]
MKTNNSFSATLHILLHLEQMDKPLTSEQMAAFIDGNPAFIRKLLAGLREKNIVCATKGHHGGWRLCRPVTEITLYDIYMALG